MTSKRPPRGQRERERIRSELIEFVAKPGKGALRKGEPVARTRGRRHVVMAPAIRSRRIDSDDLDAAVLSVT